MWTRKGKSNVAMRQAEADAALAISNAEHDMIMAVKPVLEDKVCIIDRINRENNFATKMALAYRGEA